MSYYGTGLAAVGGYGFSAAYGAFGAFAGSPTIRAGSTGAVVQAWQAFLKLTPDGKFGPATTAATVAFQKAHGLTADGAVGPQTWAAADQVLAAAGQAAAQVAQAAAAAMTPAAPAPVPAAPAPAEPPLIGAPAQLPGTQMPATPAQAAPPTGGGIMAQWQALPQTTQYAIMGGGALLLLGIIVIAASGKKKAAVATPNRRRRSSTKSWIFEMSRSPKWRGVPLALRKRLFRQELAAGHSVPHALSESGLAYRYEKNGRGSARVRVAKWTRKRQAKRPVPPAKYVRMGARSPSDYAIPSAYMYPIRFRTKSGRVKVATTKKHIRAAAQRIAKFGRRYPPGVARRARAAIDRAKRRYGIGEYR